MTQTQRQLLASRLVVVGTLPWTRLAPTLTTTSTPTTARSLTTT